MTQAKSNYKINTEANNSEVRSRLNQLHHDSPQKAFVQLQFIKVSRSRTKSAPYIPHTYSGVVINCKGCRVGPSTPLVAA